MIEEDEFSEQRIMDLASDVDDFIQKLIITYKLAPLSALSIILARLTITSKIFGAEEEFKMIIEMANMHISNNDKGVVH
jgi:hypothetical protein